MSRSKSHTSIQEAFKKLPDDFTQYAEFLPDDAKGDLFQFSAVALGERIKREFSLQPQFKDSALGRWQEMTIAMLCLYYPYSEILKFFNDVKYTPKSYGPITDPKDMMIHTILIYSFSMIRVSNYWGTADCQGDMRGVKYAIGHTGIVGVNRIRINTYAGGKGGSQSPGELQKKMDFVIKKYDAMTKKNPTLTARSAAKNFSTIDKEEWEAAGVTTPWGTSSIRNYIAQYIRRNKMAK